MSIKNVVNNMADLGFAVDRSVSRQMADSETPPRPKGGEVEPT